MSASITAAFGQDNLVSSRPEDGALLLDPAFINAWGTAIRPAGAGGHWWVANTDTSRVTLYVGDSPTVPFKQDGLSVLGVPGATAADTTIVIEPPTRNGVALADPSPTPATEMPPSNPTGQVFSGSTTDFMVSGTSLTDVAITAPSRFITVSEDGTIAAWGETGSTPAQRMDSFEVVIDNSGAGAIYKGVTVSAESGSGNLLYAANFSQNKVEVYDADWQPVATTGFVPVAPGGRDASEYAPFNIERVTDATRGEEVLIVAYARVANAAGGEEESTDGFVVKYALDGTFIAASDGDGHFNAPWGIALAPDEWGSLDGALLIGNFGDGRILGLDIDTLAFRAFLLDDQGAPVEIDGLWDIIFGNGASLGAEDRLYFSAGPEEETQGLFGSLYILDEDDQTLTGTDGDELLAGGLGQDLLLGRQGDDRVVGHAGTDILWGGVGQDSLSGGADEDWLGGQLGNDTLDGGDGADRLHARLGNDVLLGGAGDDVLVGGEDADTMSGGEGADRFRFFDVASSAADAPDLILDFTFTGTEHDRIGLARIDADTSTAGDDAFTFIGTDAFTGAGQLRAEALSGATGWRILGNVDGNVAADLVIEVVTGAAAEAGWFFL